MRAFLFGLLAGFATLFAAALFFGPEALIDQHRAA